MKLKTLGVNQGRGHYLTAGVVDMEAREKALMDGLADDLEHG